MTSASPAVERAASYILIAAIALVSFNLLVPQVLFGVAALLWIRIVAGDRGTGPLPAFVWPLAAYVVWSLLSAFLSTDPRASVTDQKQVVLFLIVPMVMRLLRGERAMTAINVIIAVGAAGALVAVVQSQILGQDNLDNRPMGLLSHYMTFSGLIMMVLCAAVARLLFYPDQRIWPGVAIPALVVALAATLTRNAYIGAAIGIASLLAIRNLKLLLLVPAAALIFVVAAPPSIKARAYSVVDLQDASNRDRLDMLQMGRDMVRDHPWFGVGPEMVGRVYGRYLRPDPVHKYNPHLHNVPVQIAAERGVPALLFWLAFVGTAAWGMVQPLRYGPARAVAGAGFAAIAAMLSAGLFEYNFGDSEFLMMFLGLITLPYAAQAASPRTPAVRSASIAA
jgi:O-antigen ligase